MTKRPDPGPRRLSAPAFAAAAMLVAFVAIAPGEAAVERTPIVRSQPLQTAPAGYRQLSLPPRLVRPLTARSRTVEFKVTHGGRPGTLAVTLTENGDLVNAFASGALISDPFRQTSPPGQPQVRPRSNRRITTWDEFWTVLDERIKKCKDKYPPGPERNKCIDDAILETIGDTIGV